jgi:hypothetical protein
LLDATKQPQDVVKLLPQDKVSDGILMWLENVTKGNDQRTAAKPAADGNGDRHRGYRATGSCLTKGLDMHCASLIAEAGTPGDAARAIQLALAPVFLLSGIAGLLSVITGRLSRITDRGRLLIEAPEDKISLLPRERANELGRLERRRYLAGKAIAACTLAALLVCVVIVLLFVQALLELPLPRLEGILFAGATISLVVGLTYFHREVHLATHTMRTEFRSLIQNRVETVEPGAQSDPVRDIRSDYDRMPPI